MEVEPADIARLAAQRLGGELDPALPAAVEAQLQGGEAPPQYEPIAISIALAALVVSATKAAWDIHRDIKADRATTAPPAPPQAQVIERRLRVTIPLDDRISADQRDRVITVVTEETIRADP